MKMTCQLRLSNLSASSFMLCWQSDTDLTRNLVTITCTCVLRTVVDADAVMDSGCRKVQNAHTWIFGIISIPFIKLYHFCAFHFSSNGNLKRYRTPLRLVLFVMGVLTVAVLDG